jgi:hypothetical protein
MYRTIESRSPSSPTPRSCARSEAGSRCAHGAPGVAGDQMGWRMSRTNGHYAWSRALWPVALASRMLVGSLIALRLPPGPHDLGSGRHGGTSQRAADASAPLVSARPLPDAGVKRAHSERRGSTKTRTGDLPWKLGVTRILSRDPPERQPSSRLSNIGQSRHSTFKEGLGKASLRPSADSLAASTMTHKAVSSSAV